MADVNFAGGSGSGATSLPEPPREPSSGPISDPPAEPPEIVLIELLFYAYRDFVSDPDAVLARFDFGRAHHRVVHFVNRQPGMRVADLLDILKITKQSLGRVLKQLIDTGYIEQVPGPVDRRQRLLYPTEKGRALSDRLTEPQARRVRAALAGLDADGRRAAEQFLRMMIDPEERDKVARLIGR
ncbi:MarR family transcriptional regulator [Kaistia algarum]|uniref:MarR family winged helix-turn-helix transcriptional regulator n=1 Tax=Kaistia algarum TaxID=2083279 RepID=UPI000CE92CBC|nr:MarR family transcriptional regulator [Kaistia algarum]